MSLGNNRDYKSRDRASRRYLAVLNARIAELTRRRWFLQRTGVHPVNCLTCTKELFPGTSIPRMSEDSLEFAHNRKYRDELIAQRRQEIAEGKLGYLGEGEFCNKDCAAMFGRATVQYMRHITLVPDPFEARVRQIGSIAQRIFPWVQKRMKGKKG